VVLSLVFYLTGDLLNEEKPDEASVRKPIKGKSAKPKRYQISWTFIKTHQLPSKVHYEIWKGKILMKPNKPQETIENTKE
jgi:hypothetical protein